MISKVLVTGAGGYIGGAIARELAGAGYAVLGGVREARALPDGVTPLVTGDLAQAALDLTGLDAVVHAAGLGHRRGLAKAAWWRANVDAPVNMARQAIAGGAKKFVLISTAHVHGRVHGGIVGDDAPVNPMDDYAASKLEAERQLAAILGPALSILRPVAVIGPHCPGNLQRVMKLLASGVPLPFGAIANQRSFIDVADLARLARKVVQARQPPGILLAASPDTLATPELVRALAAGMGVAPKLWAVPPCLLAAGAKLLGRTAMWQSLAGSFAANPQAALQLGWRPAQTLRESLVKTGKAYVV